MKKLITNYTFNASAKTVTLTDYSDIKLASLLIITNVTDGIIVYNFAEPSLNATVSGNVITLDYDTTTMSNTDELQIYYDDSEYSQKVMGAGADIDRVGFAKAVTGGVDSEWGAVVGTIATGMAVNQTGGNLVITSGTTARAETILRSNKSFSGGIRLRARNTISQRIANNNFFIELVDVIGDGLSYNITSATQMVVTFPAGTNKFTSQNVGQSMYAGNFVGTGTFLSGRYTIASVSGDTITFTVSAFATGTGTLSLFGWNYYHIIYDGTTVTNAKFDTQRRGYNTGDTVATINTTSSPGHMAIITGNDMVSILSDQVVASNSGARNTIRASRDENVPDDAQLFLQLRVANGSTAPASTTTWTIGMIAVSEYQPVDTNIQDLRQTTNIPLPVDVLRSSTITANQGTLITPGALNINSAATTNATLVKNTAGTLYNISVSNTNAAARYIKLYNKASAPTVGTDVPIVTIYVPPTSTNSYQFGVVGHRFTTGIALAITSGVADNDTGAVTANETKVIISYI